MRNLIRNGVISLGYAKKERNLVDPLTKGLCERMIIETLGEGGNRVKAHYMNLFIIKLSTLGFNRSTGVMKQIQ